MKITKNHDGTVTVTIPKVAEDYDATTGALTVSETLSAEAYKDALKPDNAAEGPPREPTEDEKARALRDVATEAARKANAEAAKAAAKSEAQAAKDLAAAEKATEKAAAEPTPRVRPPRTTSATTARKAADAVAAKAEADKKAAALVAHG